MTTVLRLVESPLVEVGRSYPLNFKRVPGVSFPLDTLIFAVESGGIILGHLEIKALVESNPGDYAAFAFTLTEDEGGACETLVLASGEILTRAAHSAILAELKQLGRVMRAQRTTSPLHISAGKLTVEIEVNQFIFEMEAPDLICESFRMSVKFSIKS